MQFRNTEDGRIATVSGDAAVAHFGSSPQWDLVNAEETPAGNDAFDPAKHNVDEVLAYIAAIDGADAEAHDAEVVRVLEAERAGKDRKSILEAVEGAPAK